MEPNTTPPVIFDSFAEEQRQYERDKKFRSELEELINRNSRENGSDTPDFILGQYLFDCLAIYDKTIQARESWFGREIFASKQANEIHAELAAQK